jgi:hypothetical protein
MITRIVIKRMKRIWRLELHYKNENQWTESYPFDTFDQLLSLVDELWIAGEID